MNPSFAETHLILSGMSAEFGYLVDHGRATQCASLFAGDAKIVFAAGSPKPGTLEGLQAIRAFLTAREAQSDVTTRHIATNFQLEWDGSAQARLASLLTVFRSDNASRQPVVSIVADVEEVFTRGADGGWLIQERRTKPVFVTAPQGP